MFWGGCEGVGVVMVLICLYVGGKACLEFLGLALGFASKKLL